MGTCCSVPDDAYDDERIPFGADIDSWRTDFFKNYSFDMKGDPVLGQGGFSTVMRGIKKGDKNKKTRYAIKCIRMTPMKEQARLEAQMSDKDPNEAEQAAIMDLYREKSILEELNHPHIIKMYDFYEDEANDMYWMVMECVQGGELFDKIVQKWAGAESNKIGYNEAEARATAGLILHTVGYLHERKIAHRDLKPENLLCESEDLSQVSLKLADFGFAVKCDGENQMDALGTPGYVAPEIVSYKPHGLPVDMWSCGVILFVLLGGYPPFQQPDENDPAAKEKMEAMYSKIKRADFKFQHTYWKNISNEARSLIQGLLTVDTKNRLTAKQALDHPWFKMDKDSLESRSLNESLTELKRWQARRRLKAAMNTVRAGVKMKKLLSGVKSAAAEGDNKV